jgi:hypothetical protein
MASRSFAPIPSSSQKSRSALAPSAALDAFFAAFTAAYNSKEALVAELGDQTSSGFKAALVDFSEALVRLFHLPLHLSSG